MKKFVLFSVLSAFCLSVASCTMVNNKDDKKKKPSQSPSRHRRYHSELVIDR